MAWEVLTSAAFGKRPSIASRSRTATHSTSGVALVFATGIGENRAYRMPAVAKRVKYKETTLMEGEARPTLVLRKPDR